MTVVEIKAEIFDILYEQERLKQQINQLEGIKNQKLQMLDSAILAENQNQGDNL